MGNEYAAKMRQGFKLPALAKDKTGRLPAYVPNQNDREIVQVLIANGVAEAIIAKVLHIAVNTLNKYYSEEMEIGRAMVTAHMGAALVKEGFAGNVAALRFWLATRGGQEWALAKDDYRFGRNAEIGQADEGVVHFYMPPNGRDQPEQLEGPIIEGEATKDEAA